MKLTMLQQTNTQIIVSSISSAAYQQKNIQQDLHSLEKYFMEISFNKYHKRDRNENEIITNI